LEILADDTNIKINNYLILILFKTDFVLAIKHFL